MSQTPAKRKQNLTPAWIIVGLQAALIIAAPFLPETFRGLVSVFGPMLMFAFFLAWLFLRSGLRFLEWVKLLGSGLILFLVFGLIMHVTTLPALLLYGVPVLMLAAAYSIFKHTDTPGMRYGTMAMILVPFLLVLCFFRIEGFTGGFEPEWSLRWAPTIEDRSIKMATSSNGWQPVTEEWPAFRGPKRDGRAIDSPAMQNWQTNPPTELWRTFVGPGWSSFALVSDRLFTQEQRGEMEWVSCYDAATGALIWHYEDQTRFTETISGAGPRGTPTYAKGRIFALGSKGLLSALDAATGKVLWQHDLVKEVQAKVPTWGFSCSPLVVDDQVIIYADGQGDNGLIAYGTADGKQRWQVAGRGSNYSSPQLISPGGIPMIFFADSAGFHGYQPETGSLLWTHKPKDMSGTPIVQAQITDTGDLIVSLGEGIGVARLKITGTVDKLEVAELWSSNSLKPNFNDFLFHEDNLYGFDKNIFASAGAQTGERIQKRGRYGYGQAILLPRAEQILVTSEKGELVLLSANAGKMEELGRMAALEGKTWNHPIVAGDRLFIRNGNEMACYQLHTP